MGRKDFPKANCVRAFYGEAFFEKEQTGAEAVNNHVTELCCNIDDMTGEDIGFAMERFLELGALDAFTTPVYMKKNRPGVMITVICQVEAADEMARQMLRYTSSFGVRRRDCQRYTLSRRMEEVDTAGGTLRVKQGQGYGITKSKPEYEDLAEQARRKQVSTAEVRSSIQTKL
jgi:hypothetical protein